MTRLTLIGDPSYPRGGKDGSKFKFLFFLYSQNMACFVTLCFCVHYPVTRACVLVENKDILSKNTSIVGT